jgi:hypothetical protein
MTSDNFCFYLQNRLIQTSQTGGQWYSDTLPSSIPWTETISLPLLAGQQLRAGLTRPTQPLSHELQRHRDLPGQGPNVIKLFANVCNKLECLYLEDLSSQSKAGAYPSEAPRCFTSVSSGITYKHLTRLEKPARN